MSEIQKSIDLPYPFPCLPNNCFISEVVTSQLTAAFPGWPCSFGCWYFWSDVVKFLRLTIFRWSFCLDTSESP